MIFAKNCHDLLGFGGLGESRKASQIAEHHGHLATVAFEKPVPIFSRNDEVGYLSTVSWSAFWRSMDRTRASSA